MVHEDDDVDAGAKIAESGFDDNKTGDQMNAERLKALKEKLDADLREAMLKALDQVREELQNGVLHGLVMLRVNQKHETASSIAICNMAANEVGSKLQEMAMDLMLPAGAAREIRGFMEMLNSLGKTRN